MDPQGPSQPRLDTAYDTPGNPTDHTPQESSTASSKERSNAGSIVVQRDHGDIPVPSTHNQEATPSSLGYGARDASGDKGDAMGSAASDLDGEQMRAPGEGDVYRQQLNKEGFGEQKDLASDLDRKKAEQAGRREEVKEQRREDVDVGGALGGRGGVAVVEGR